MILPFILVISISITDEKSLLKNGYQFIPKDFSLLAYEVIFKSPYQLITSYGVTIFVTVFGTILSLLITTLIAYTISRRDYRYRRITTVYLMFTMLFSGGIIPMYILMTQYLHLGNTIWALILPYLLNPFYVLIMKGFLDRIPFEVIQSAKIDGASEWQIFIRIIIPLSTPALATVGLFTSFLYWNDWWLGLLFIDNQNLTPLQLLLYRIMNTIDFLANNADTANVSIDLSKFPSHSVRMAMAVLAAGPMMFVFPFFKRFFVKGITVGSVKE
jgi:putative aldouronate transport system permease protein